MLRKTDRILEKIREIEEEQGKFTEEQRKSFLQYEIMKHRRRGGEEIKIEKEGGKRRGKQPKERELLLELAERFEKAQKGEGEGRARERPIIGGGGGDE
jgi:hypothetical protein